jgi:predicted PurR-regulated permease PerM
MKLEVNNKVETIKLIVLITVLTIMVIGCGIILLPFIPAILWAIILCLTTWPAYHWIRENITKNQTLSAAIMTLFLAVCFILPLIFMGSSLAENFTTIKNLFIEFLEGDRQPPEFLVTLPLIGDYIRDFWNQYLIDTAGMKEALQNNAEAISNGLITVGASIGRGLVDISLGIVFAFFFFCSGEQVAQRLNTLIGNYLGKRGQSLLDLSKKTMIGVVYGVIGAALAQGMIAGIGFAIAGVPAAALLGFLTFFLSFVPMGPPLIWVAATVWLFTQDQMGWAIFMIGWGIIVSSVDTFIRPYFISMGSSLPLLLVLLGVFGGIIAFGFIGLFIGPTLLAVAYSLVLEWSSDNKVKPVRKKRRA